MIVWLQFVACTAVILFAGAKLSKYGDIIAEKTGLGRTWIGVVLMASSSIPSMSMPLSAAGKVSPGEMQSKRVPAEPSTMWPQPVAP